MSRKQVTKKNEQEFSKFLSFILRHHPEEIGLELEDNGWVSTERLIDAINNHESSKWNIDISILEEIVSDDDKGRYSFTDDKYKIRANQGHSIKGLKMEFKEATDVPRYLYHGTSEESIKLIKESGYILPMSRQMVHLSKDIDTATKVGKRHGNVRILQIDTSLLRGYTSIYVSDNGVYLVDKVPMNCVELL